VGLVRFANVPMAWGKTSFFFVRWEKYKSVGLLMPARWSVRVADNVQRLAAVPIFYIRQPGAEAD